MSTRRPGRPAIGGRIAVNLGPKLIEALDDWALEVGLNRAEAIRALLVSALHIDSEVRANVPADS